MIRVLTIELIQAARKYERGEIDYGKVVKLQELLIKKYNEKLPVCDRPHKG